MANQLSKQEILDRLSAVTTEFSGFCSGIPNEIFFRQPAEKWSVAQNVLHLTKAAGITRLAFFLPRPLIRLYAGKPNRPSRSYDELVAKYNMKLEQGGRASGPYIPKKVPAKIGKEKLLAGFSGKMKKISAVLNHKWKDPQLDNYIAPHPLLGKITLRELCYFTIFHTQHHLSNIKKLLNN